MTLSTITFSTTTHSIIIMQFCTQHNHLQSFDMLSVTKLNPTECSSYAECHGTHFCSALWVKFVLHKSDLFRGTLTEGEESVHLTSFYYLVSISRFLYFKHCLLCIKQAGLMTRLTVAFPFSQCSLPVPIRLDLEGQGNELTKPVPNGKL
jgi:hypothetical protein